MIKRGAFKTYLIVVCSPSFSLKKIYSHTSAESFRYFQLHLFSKNIEK